MRAITLLYPWAALIAAGRKTIETRPWATSYRGPLAIHVSKRFPREHRRFCEQHPLYANVFSGFPADQYLGNIMLVCTLADIVPVAGLSPEQLQRTCGDHTHGEYAWLLKDVRVLTEPILAKGSLGIWKVSDEAIGMIRESAAPTSDPLPTIHLEGLTTCSR